MTKKKTRDRIGDLGSIKRRSRRDLRFLSGGVVAWWRSGEVAFSSAVAWWRGGVVAWWRGGVAAWWRGGVVAWWSGGFPFPTELI